MSVLKIADEISELPYKFPQLIDGIKLWIFLYIAKLNTSRITIVSIVFWIFFPVNASFSERFPEKCPTFHSHVGHYKERIECSFHSWKYWAGLTVNLSRPARAFCPRQLWTWITYFMYSHIRNKTWWRFLGTIWCGRLVLGKYYST